MSHEPTGAIEGLPENARRPLEPGEVYIPIVPDEAGVYEVTARAVTLGLLFCALFAMGAVKQITGSTEAKNAIHILTDRAFEGIPGEVIGTITLVALCVFVVRFSRRAKAETYV